jgi:hypothetical protein
MKVFLATILYFDNNNKYSNIIKRPKIFKTEEIARKYVANKIFELFVKKVKHEDIYQPDLIKDDLSVMLVLREQFLTGNLEPYIIDYDIEEEDVIENLAYFGYN